MKLDSVHNYYERLVFNEITDNYLQVGLDDDQLADMACIALNEISPRYIRHDVDMSFFMTNAEFISTHDKVKNAVSMAYKKIQAFRERGTEHSE